MARPHAQPMLLRIPVLAIVFAVVAVLFMFAIYAARRHLRLAAPGGRSACRAR